MDWFLYDIGLRHERVNIKRTRASQLTSVSPEIFKKPLVLVF